MKPCGPSCQCQVFHQETLDKVKQSLYTDDEFIHLSKLFKIFDDPSRLKILEAIKEDSLCVCDLASLLGVTKSAVSHQLKFLKRYDLVVHKKSGKMVYYTLKDLKTHHIIDNAYQLLKGFNIHEKNH